MRRNRLDTNKVLRKIYRYQPQLREAIENKSDYEKLHKEIANFLIIVCETKTEYKNLINYPMPPNIKQIVYCGPDGKEFDRISTYSEQALTQSRIELAVQLQVKLTELSEKFKLIQDLEKSVDYGYKYKIKSINKNIKDLKNELLRLKKEVNNIIKDH